MNIKKIMIGAAFCAALSVLPACGGGGGGGSSSGESQDAGGSSSGNAEDYAPSDLVGKKASVITISSNAKTKRTFTFSSNGKLNTTVSNSEQTYSASGTYTYRKTRANNANLHMEYVAYELLSNGTRTQVSYVYDVALTFSSPSAAYAYMKISYSGDGIHDDTETYGGSMTFQ